MVRPRAAQATPLESWHALQKHIHQLPESELISLIQEELKGKARRNMCMRMFMKLNKLRYRREREALEKQIKAAAKKK